MEIFDQFEVIGGIFSYLIALSIFCVLFILIKLEKQSNEWEKVPPHQ
tara:strand:- start:180 stop:320 length:141 start_codon:yes stop_codon:yes gene_type:complete